MNKKYMALKKDGELLEETHSEAEIFRWAWYSDYERDDIDIISAPSTGGHISI